MVPQTETKSSAGFKAGVKDYRLTYYTPDYVVKETDILAIFRVTPPSICYGYFLFFYYFKIKKEVVALVFLKI